MPCGSSSTRAGGACSRRRRRRDARAVRPAASARAGRGGRLGRSAARRPRRSPAARGSVTVNDEPWPGVLSHGDRRRRAARRACARSRGPAPCRRAPGGRGTRPGETPRRPPPARRAGSRSPSPRRRAPSSRPAGLGADLDGAGLGELQRVADQVRQDLRQLRGVADDGLERRAATVSSRSPFRRAPPRRSPPAPAAAGRDETTSRRSSALPDSILEMSSTSLISPSRRRALRWTRSRLSLLLRVELALGPPQQRPREPEDHGHGRAQLVGDGGEEAVLEGGGALELLRGAGDAAALLLEQLVLLGEAARLRGSRSLAEAFASATARLGAIAVSVLRARAVKGVTAPSASTPTASPKYISGRWRLSRGRMRPSKRSTVGVCASTETRMGFPSRAARTRSSRLASLEPAEPPTAAAGRKSPAVGQVEHRAGRAGHLEDLVEQPRAEALEVVDGGRRGEHRVDRGLDVPRGECPRPFRVEARRLVEVAAELADLVARRVGQARHLAPGREVASARAAEQHGAQDPAVHVREQPQQPDEDERRRRSARSSRRRVALEPLLRDRLAARRRSARAHEGVAQLRGGGRRPVVAHRECLAGRLPFRAAIAWSAASS